jgi:hypothetical protein
MVKSVLKSGCVFILLLFVSMICGMFFGVGYAVFENRGRFVKWSEIETPPGTPSKILLIDADQIWIQTPDGKIFWNPASSDCETDCWKQVSDLSMEPTVRYDNAKIMPEPCSHPPPISDVIDQRGECEQTGLYSLSRVYAIKSNGQLMAWKAYTGSEWDIWNMALRAVNGAFLSLVIGVPLASFLTFKIMSKVLSRKPA